MNKKEIQERVLKNGKKLALSKFSWSEKTKTFSTKENEIVLDFKGIYLATIKCGDSSTIKCGEECVIIRQDIYQVFEKSNTKVQVCSYLIKGYLEEGIYSETGKPAIIADRIFSKVKSEKTNKGVIIRKVINHGESKQSYLLEIDGVFSHGSTLQEAKESYKYKILNRDTSKYDGLTLDSKLTETKSIQLYRTITGACENGTRYFVENLKVKPRNLTVRSLIELTSGQYNHEILVKFFNKRGDGGER